MCKPPEPAIPDAVKRKGQALSRTFFALLWLGFLCSTPHPAPAQTVTAFEAVAEGVNAYNAGDYAKAEGLFMTFLTNYGSNEVALQAVTTMRPLLAMCYVHLKKYERALKVIGETLAGPAIQPGTLEELRFWQGVCQLQLEELTPAREKLLGFARDFPKSNRAREAQLLAGTTLLLESKFADCAAFFEPLLGQWQGFDRGRAIILRLYALLSAKKNDDALRLVVEEYPRAGDIVQLVSFQTLALQLGSDFLEKGEHRKAIAALQRVWRKDRLVAHQEERLAKMQAALEAARKRPGNDYRIFQLGQIIGKIESELTAFEKVEQFDAALRLRLARAFQEMQRWREAALVLEDMLRELPAAPLVESGTVNLLQCWMQIERWPKAVEAADFFAKKFPQSKQLPLVAFLKGQALQEDQLFAEAVAVFAGIVAKTPADEIAGRALFMQGFCQLLAEDYTAGIGTLASVPKKYPKDSVVASALYWRGMGLSLTKKHEAARGVLAEYLKLYPKGQYEADAVFRRAYCAQSMRDFEVAIPELRKFLGAYPDSGQRSEALILLGDAELDRARIDQGIVTLKKIDPKDTRFFDEGWFKIGKALRLQEKVPQLRAHMQQFVKEHPRSPRVAEAIYWIGWTWRLEGEDSKARVAYWEAIGRLGDDSEAQGVLDLFSGLAKLYPGEDGRSGLVSRLNTERQTAESKKQNVLATRLLWAEAKVLERTNPERAAALFALGAQQAKVDTTSPALLADFADPLRAQGKNERAGELYAGLIKWNPRAVQKDRAFAGLGLIALEAGREDEALKYFTRFQQETLGSTLLGRILLAKAELLRKRGENAEAQATLEALLAEKAVGTKEKAAALYQIGDLLMAQKKPRLAVPYFQRVYVMYGRWRDVVAQSYLASGQAFEAMDDRESAVKTYRELTAQEDLAEYAEATTARQRLTALGEAPL